MYTDAKKRSMKAQVKVTRVTKPKAKSAKSKSKAQPARLEEVKAAAVAAADAAKGFVGQAPSLLAQVSKNGYPLRKIEQVQWESEKIPANDPSYQHLLPKPDHHLVYYRTANHFAFVESGTRRMVCPKAMQAGSKDDQQYDLIAFVTPLSDGARRASRAVAGYTPLQSGMSHPDLWQYQLQYVRIPVCSPIQSDISFFRCRLPLLVVPGTGTLPAAEYVLQQPDPSFRLLFVQMLAENRCLALNRKARKMVPHRDVDLAGPRPWWMNAWAMRVLRLEYELPPTHPADPTRPAMLGACRRLDSNRRAPETEKQWLEISPDSCDPRDDTEGSDDAQSILDEPECGMPTAGDWDPVTKLSRTPVGNEHLPPATVEYVNRRRAEALALAAAALRDADASDTPAPGLRDVEMVGPGLGEPGQGADGDNDEEDDEVPETEDGDAEGPQPGEVSGGALELDTRAADTGGDTLDAPGQEVGNVDTLDGGVGEMELDPVEPPAITIDPAILAMEAATNALGGAATQVQAPPVVMPSPGTLGSPSPVPVTVVVAPTAMAAHNLPAADVSGRGLHSYAAPSRPQILVLPPPPGMPTQRLGNRGAITFLRSNTAEP